MEWRLVDTGISPPGFTAAADDAISQARSGGIVPDTLHLYRRDRPTVSLGYFQKAAEAADLEFCRRGGIAVVRRITGGGAVYTDPGHLIFALAVGEETLPVNRERAFERSCAAVVAGLRGMGVEAEYKPVNDVLVGGRKISGSAQVRRAGVVLLHGTLVMRNDPDVMSRALRMDIDKLSSRGFEPSTYVTSLSDVLGREPDPEDVKARLVAGFEEVFGVETVRTPLTEWEMSRAEELTEAKYGQDGWNLRS